MTIREKYLKILEETTSHGLILAEIPTDSYGTKLVVIKHDNGYDLNRYFTIGNSYYVSYDHRNLKEDQIWKEIEKSDFDFRH